MFYNFKQFCTVKFEFKKKKKKKKKKFFKSMLKLVSV